MKFVQFAFLVPQVKVQILSYPCQTILLTITIVYKGEINLYFDLPSLCSCLVHSPLLREIITPPHVHAQEIK